MFVIAYDLAIVEANEHHPKGSRGAYAEIEKILVKHGFERTQLSVFAAKEENLGNLVRAVLELKSKEWFGKSIKSIRAFRMELGTDLTPIFADLTT